MYKKMRQMMAELAAHNPVVLADVGHFAQSPEGKKILAGVIDRSGSDKSRIDVSRERSQHRTNVNNIRFRHRLFVSASVVSVAAIAVAFIVIAPSGSPTRPVSPASAMLLRLAKVAASSPAAPLPGPNQYLYTETQNLSIVGHGTGFNEKTRAQPLQAYSTSVQVTQTWVNPAGLGRQLNLNSSTAEPAWLTPGAEQVFGGPKGSLGGDQMSYNSGPYPFLYPGNLQLNLPSDPKTLKQALELDYANYIAGIEATRGVSNSSNLTTAQLFQFVRDGLTNGLSPKVRSALYTMLAGLPGVRSLGRIADDLGKTGVGIATAATSNGMTTGEQEQIIFNPTTSALLEWRDVQVSPNKLATPIPGASNGGATEGGPSNSSRVSNPPIGSVLNYTIYLSMGVVNSDTVTPQGTTIPAFCEPPFPNIPNPVIPC